jgi:hypothetical protein
MFNGIFTLLHLLGLVSVGGRGSVNVMRVLKMQEKFVGSGWSFDSFGGLDVLEMKFHGSFIMTAGLNEQDLT